MQTNTHGNKGFLCDSITKKQVFGKEKASREQLEQGSMGVDDSITITECEKGLVTVGKTALTQWEH
jgi:hypothetical protein